MSDTVKKYGKFRTFIILGAPGSGKGTQGKVLGTIPRFHHFSIGDAFRSLDTRTSIGLEFVEHSSKGQLVPDELTVKFWRTQIRNQIDIHIFKPDIDFLLLDGIPRSVSQAELLSDSIELLQIFHLCCPDRKELARRLTKRALKEGRLDDASDEVIQKRIRFYEEETKPILDYYGTEKVTDIDAFQQPAKVLLDILQSMQKLPCWDDYLNLRV